MSKMIDLGTVTKRHSSGVCETSKKQTVFGEFNVGDKIEMDAKSKRVSIKPSKGGKEKDEAETVGAE